MIHSTAVQAGPTLSAQGWFASGERRGLRPRSLRHRLGASRNLGVVIGPDFPVIASIWPATSARTTSACHPQS
jgi:hypothetical protein